MNHARRLLLTLARAGGSGQRRASQGWGAAALWLAAVALALLVLPALVNLAFRTVPDGAWKALEAGDPHLAYFWSVETVVAVAAVMLAIRWLVRARRRVVVEGFLDYTNGDGQAVEGLATLLIAELSRLSELYGRVNDELSTPISVRARGGAAPDVHPGAFLSVTADDVSAVFNDAVAIETTVAFAGFKIPIGWLMSVLGRIARGPRIVGSLHNTDATGGPTLTAQLVGGKQAQQWRVDGAAPAAGAALDAAFLDPMIDELACRMFNDLTLRGSVRWRAIRSFTEYLDLYWESHRTPRDRGAKLESAEGKLLEAIAEDEAFDLGFYNLGVVYSELAQIEREAAERSEYVKRSDRPHDAYEARLDAALAAFSRAVALNRDRTEAVYALAVHEYTRMGRDSAALESVVCRCQRVLELDRRHAQAHDLMGMALMGLGRLDESEVSHRAAVAESWRRLRATERAERRTPPTADSLVPAARSNLAVATRNLADAHRVLAAYGDNPRPRTAHAARLYGQACELATGDTKAVMLQVYGQMLDSQGDSERALERYLAALKIDPENPVHWAHMAGAHAALPGGAANAERFADAAFGHLAPIYRHTLELHHSPAFVALRDCTLNALRRTYARLRDRAAAGSTDRLRFEAAAARIDRLPALWWELEHATARRDVGLLLTIRARYGAAREWEREQVQIALARTLGRHGRWAEARATYSELIGLLERVRPAGIVQHSLHAKHARALRNTGLRQEALEAAAHGRLMDPLSACARRELGKAHFALLQFEEALDAWQQTLWLSPNDPYLHWKVAFCHWRVAQDRRDDTARRAALLEAAAGFDRAAVLFGVRMAEGWAWSQLWTGRVRLELGELDAAHRHLRSATGCRPTETAGALLLGELLASLEDYEPSRVLLRRALAAVGKPAGRLVDADWGETLVDREVRDRARAALKAPPLRPVDDHGLKRAA